MRLDKYLANSGLGSRKEVKKLITNGRVQVNDQICKKSDCVIQLNQDSVKVDTQYIMYQANFYYILNKPQGIISATEDKVHQTVIDWLGPSYAYQQLFPVGRLDIDTTGLLLLTNNGDLAHQLLSPRHKVNKTYQALIAGLVTQADIEAFAAGLDLGDFITQPAILKVVQLDQSQQLSQIEVTIQEGKFHQVKRMFEAVGKQVLKLHRLTMGPLTLDANLEIGQWRPLTQEEATALIPYGFK